MTVRGVDDVLRNLGKAGGLLNDAAASAAEAVGQDVRSHATRFIQRQSTGRLVYRYTAGGNRYQHVAAGPGEAPNTDTGRLVNSLKVWPEGHNTRVGSDVIYGKYLEFGTQRMQPRPFMVPAKELAEKTKRKRLQSAIDRELAKL